MLLVLYGLPACLLRERIRKDSGAKFYGVSQNDCYNFCECPNCKAVDDEEGSHAGRVREE